MTRPGPLRRWDALRSLDVLTNTGVAAAYLSLFVTLRQLVIGRRLTVRTDAGDVTLTVAALVSRLGLRAVVAGQLNAVRLTARDVHWNGHRFDRATAVLHDVHLRGTVPPVLVAAPVELTVDLAAASVDHLFRLAAPRFAGRVEADGTATMGFARRTTGARIEVEIRLDGTTLWLHPRAVVGRRRWPLPTRIPGYPVRLPELPDGLVVSAVTLLPGTVRVSAVLPQWRAEVPRTRLEDVVAQLSSASRSLVLIWPDR